MHSPFVFDLVTKCLYDKTQLKEFSLLENYRKELLSNQSKIHVTDFGAGSKVFSSNVRQVSKIAHYAGISKKRAQLLLRLTQYFQPNNMLEIGTSLGIGTSALSLGKPDSKIITLEGCQETLKIAQMMFAKHQLKNIKAVQGNFQDTYYSEIKGRTFDLIYFDGNHTKEATLQYFDACLTSVHNDTVLIFDDIHWSTDMEDAWKEIKNHEKVTVTIDTYQWGLVFFRREQEKEHFIIRV